MFTRNVYIDSMLSGGSVNSQKLTPFCESLKWGFLNNKISEFSKIMSDEFSSVGVGSLIRLLIIMNPALVFAQALLIS